MNWFVLLIPFIDPPKTAIPTKVKQLFLMKRKMSDSRNRTSPQTPPISSLDHYVVYFL